MQERDEQAGAAPRDSGCPLYTAEIPGSLLRPPVLLKAREALQAGEMTPEEYRKIEDACVDAAIRLQEAAGFPVVTDGEQRRMTFCDFVLDITPLTRVSPPPVILTDEQGKSEEFTVPASIAGTVRPGTGSIVGEYIDAQARTLRPVKVTLPSPFLAYVAWHPEVSRRAYPNPFRLFTDAAALIRAQAQELAALGCTYIQFDAPEQFQLWTADDDTLRTRMESVGLPAERIRQEGIDVLNSIASDLPGVTTALHMCSANFRSKALVHGSYAGVADNLFPRLKNFDVVFLEWDDSPRAGSFDVLHKLPEDVGIMLGLVSSKRPGVERLDDVMKHVHDAARHVGLRRLGISTQCGFASEASGNLITPQIQEQKLRLVTAAAAVMDEEAGSARA